MTGTTTSYGPRMLWVDDAKPAPEGMAVARTYDDALRMLRRFEYDVLYLDHDLGDQQGRTGLDLLRQLITDGRVPERVECISWNPAGKARIEAEIADLGRRHAAELAKDPPRGLRSAESPPHCAPCDRPEICDVIAPGTAPCGANRGLTFVSAAQALASGVAEALSDNSVADDSRRELEVLLAAFDASGAPPDARLADTEAQVALLTKQLATVRRKRDQWIRRHEIVSAMLHNAERRRDDAIGEAAVLAVRVREAETRAGVMDAECERVGDECERLRHYAELLERGLSVPEARGTVWGNESGEIASA